MSTDDEGLLRANVAAAECEVRQLRASKKCGASTLGRYEDSPDGAATGPSISERLRVARQRLTDAQRALAVFTRTGTVHGMVAEDGEVYGTVAVLITPGAGADARQVAIEWALQGRLETLARDLGAVLAARPASYTKERPGRDAQGRVVLVVEGRVEGDRLVPTDARAPSRRRR